MKLTRAAELLEESGHETLTYYGFPDSHWIKLRTNNPLERIMREIRRRTQVVGAFPDGKSCLNLAAARLRHIAGTQWSTRRFVEHDSAIRGSNPGSRRRVTESAKNLDNTRRHGHRRERSRAERTQAHRKRDAAPLLPLVI